VENLPWEECIERYDRPHTFFYLDPPYWETEGYGVPFEFDQYRRMAMRLRSMQGKAMVSINDHPDIRAAFAGLPMLELGVQYSVRGAAERKISSELVITNFDTSDGGLFAGEVSLNC
jgi:DNA adenine methylase